MPPSAPVVAIFNTSEDTTDLLRFVLEQAGFVAVSALTTAFRDGVIDLDRFMHVHQPRVVVYDIALPYDVNWRQFERVRSSPACAGIEFVVTSTNIAHVEKVAGPGLAVIELVGKPYDLDQIVQAVTTAARAGAQR